MIVQLTCTEGHHYTRDEHAVRLAVLNGNYYAVAHCNGCDFAGATLLRPELLTELQAAGVPRIQRNALTEKWMRRLERTTTERAITETEADAAIGYLTGDEDPTAGDALIGAWLKEATDA